MKTLIRLSFVAFSLILLGLTVSQQSRGMTGAVSVSSARQVMVRWERGVAEKGRLDAYGQDKLDVLDHNQALNMDLVKIPDGLSVEDMVKRLAKIPGVRYAEPDFQVSLPPGEKFTMIETPAADGHAPPNAGPKPDGESIISSNDALRSLQWSLSKIGWDTAVGVTQGSANVIIAILDTGVDLSHEDLSSKLVQGHDFVRSDPSRPQDDNGHGTHVAGIAAAATNNGKGVAGACPNCRIMPVKVLDNRGVAYASKLIAGMTWAADNGARIINLSIGGVPNSQALQDGISYAVSRGVLIFAGAGNSGHHESEEIPASLNGVIAVAATNQNDRPAWFTSSGPYVKLTAPGDSIASTWPNNQYAYVSGTSMSTPLVAGIAGLLASQGRSNSEILAILQNSAVDLIPNGWDEENGHGRIDAGRAVQGGSNAPQPQPTATPGWNPYPPTATPWSPPPTATPYWYPPAATATPGLQGWRLIVDCNTTMNNCSVSRVEPRQ